MYLSIELTIFDQNFTNIQNLLKHPIKIIVPKICYYRILHYLLAEINIFQLESHKQFFFVMSIWGL